MRFLCRHKFVREGDEPYIKCECGKTIDFEQIDAEDDLLPADYTRSRRPHFILP